MTLEDFAEVIQQPLVIRHRLNWKRGARFYALFEDGEVKEGPILKGEFGNGATPHEALRDYAASIAGKLLVFGAMSSKERREFKVPQELL